MLKEYRVKFLPIERSFPAEEGQTILETAMKAGVHINASCGGNGACGKCKDPGGRLRIAVINKDKSRRICGRDEIVMSNNDT
jgi:uncharacterized 2Fe-2S/4Fe-4S cluster protein (DUF4445 family)